MLKEYTVVLQTKIDLIAEVTVYAENEEDILGMGWSKEEMKQIKWRTGNGKILGTAKFDTEDTVEIDILDVVPGPPRLSR